MHLDYFSENNMTYLLHKPHSFYKAKTMRFSYAQLSLGRYDDAWDYLRRIYRTHARHHQCRTGFFQGSNHAMHYYDRYHVLLGRAYGNCNKSRHHRTAFSKVEATDSFPVPKSSGQSPCCHPHHHEYHC